MISRSKFQITLLAVVFIGVTQVTGHVMAGVAAVAALLFPKARG